MLTGDIYFKLAFGGLSLVSDLGNLFVSPVISWRLFRQKHDYSVGLPESTELTGDRTSTESNLGTGMVAATIAVAKRIDRALALVMLGHVFEFYPEAIPAALGIFDVTWILLMIGAVFNLIFLGFYIMVVATVPPQVLGSIGFHLPPV